VKFLRGLFGDPADTHEERGDLLRLAGQWREAAWFYGQALDAARDEARRERLRLLEEEAARQAFRQLLEESASLARRRMVADAESRLRDAEPFARNGEDESVLRARRLALRDAAADAAPRAAPAGARDFETDDDAVPADDDRDERAFRERMTGRPDAERRRFETLGADGRRGFVALGAGDHAAALEAFQKEVAARPECWVALELMGQSLEGLGRFDDAVRQYEAAYRRAPDRHVLLLEVARIQKDRLGKPDTALERLERAALRHEPAPDCLDLHLERVFLRVDLGRDTEALYLLDQLLAVPGVETGVLYFNRAGLHEQAGRLEEAEVDLREAIDAAPGNVLYLERAADLIFRARRDFLAALELLDRALRVDAHDFAGRRGGLGTSPDRARLQFKAARILYLLDRLPEARARVDEGLIVCNDPRVEEALLDLRRDLGGVDDVN
jgi:tetratricopeptide (TPR) repeat protein